MATSSSKKQDFDPEALAQTTEQHGKDISGHDERIESLENIFKNPEQFAKAFEAVSSDSKKLDKLFSKLFCDMMEKDEDVKAAVTRTMNRTDRSAVFSTLKKWGGFITAGVIYILGVLTRALIDWITKKF